MNSINNFLVKTDCFCDYVPLVSSLTNFIDLFQKCVILPLMDKNTIASSHYYKHINEKSLARCFLLVIPVVGNIIVGVYDFSKKKGDGTEIESPNTPPSHPLNAPSEIDKGNVRLREEDADKEIRVPFGKPFSIELGHSPSTGHSSWKISQLPSFINQVDNYVNYRDCTPDFCGGGNDYGFVFEPKASGMGSIIMKQPCSFDESRTVEKTFTIIAE